MCASQHRGCHSSNPNTRPMHLQVARERQASITIQAAWRGRQQRRHLAACHLAAARIQASFLARQQRLAYLQLRSATIHLQVCSLCLPPCMARKPITPGTKHSYCNSHACAIWQVAHLPSSCGPTLSPVEATRVHCLDVCDGRPDVLAAQTRSRLPGVDQDWAVESYLHTHIALQQWQEQQAVCMNQNNLHSVMHHLKHQHQQSCSPTVAECHCCIVHQYTWNDVLLSDTQSRRHDAGKQMPGRQSLSLHAPSSC